MKLYVVRHGETDWNKARRMQGRTDIPLNEKGIEMAKKTGLGMADVPLDLCFCGPLIRTRQTAENILAGRDVPIIVDPRIIEFSFGEWEGECILNSDKITPGYLDLFHGDAWSDCPRAPKGENFYDVLARTKDFYDDITSNPDYADKSILISTHGAASRCLLHNVFPESHDLWLGCIPPNCSVSIIEVKDGVSTLVELDHIYYSV